MTVCLYQTDPNCRHFESRVTEVRGDWIVLESTAFYPGGGGQDPDRGTLSGAAVEEVKKDNGNVLHKVPGHHFTVGDVVQGKIDWTRRYDLMQGHTGEHLLFSSLSRVSPELKVVKIAITPEKKSVIVSGELDWERVKEAERLAMEAIARELAITERIVGRDDPYLEETRVKLDRIHGDSVRIIEIGDVDRAACSGVHVENTRELEMLLVTGVTSARPVGDLEVEFQVGNRAKMSAAELAITALRAAEALGSTPNDLLGALGNLIRDRERATAALRKYGAKALEELVPSDINGVKLYSGIFENMDKKTITDAATRFIRDRAACVLGTVGERFMLIVACDPSIKVNCVEVLNKALEKVGGRGGGKSNFATGGAPESKGAEEAIVVAIALVTDALMNE
ncbi:MAG: alanine--tRNA ligase-related protein [Methanomassiliicoccus sp.]|nr:alanine--tRNA ligase-related protein [Methanomassiliicoccus sp.]